jgi:hypothetical protein
VGSNGSHLPLPPPLAERELSPQVRTNRILKTVSRRATVKYAPRDAKVRCPRACFRCHSAAWSNCAGSLPWLPLVLLARALPQGPLPLPFRCECVVKLRSVVASAPARRGWRVLLARAPAEGADALRRMLQ